VGTTVRGFSELQTAGCLFFARPCLLGRIPAADFRYRLLIHMADIPVTPEATHIIGFDDVLVNQHFHLTSRSAKRVEHMATATGNVIVRLQIAIELCSQLRSSLFPFFPRRNGLVRLIPKIFCSAGRLKQQHLHVLGRRRVTGVVRDMALPAACAYTGAIYEVRPLMVPR